jgi:hypothetical protein
MSAVTGGGGQQPPEQPPFNPIKIPKLADKALEQDLRKYFSYQFPVFPGMTDVRQAEIEDAYKQLTSPLSPEFQNEFLKNAVTTNRSVTGGGNPYSGMGLTKGSFNQGSTSASFTRQAMAKQDYDRSRMEGLQQQNPIPGIGLSQNDLLSLYIYNTGAQNAWSMSNYANQVAGANASFAAQQNDYNSIGNLVSGLGSIYANYQFNQGG